MTIGTSDITSIGAPLLEDIEMFELSSESPSMMSMSSSSSAQVSLTSQATTASAISVASTVIPPGLFVVLGKETLKEIWKDNSDVSLPSWIGRVPSRIGDAKVGKLSADQYRTTCTINLVVTLVRLWTEDGRQRYRDMLDNFMDLVTAINLAHMRVLTPRTIKLYEEVMLKYLRGLRRLYPSVSLTPSQHLSLHLGQVMRRFGPVHAWRCFPFERYNGLLQNIPTNCKFGKPSYCLYVPREAY